MENETGRKKIKHKKAREPQTWKTTKEIGKKTGKRWVMM